MHRILVILILFIGNLNLNAQRPAPSGPATAQQKQAAWQQHQQMAESSMFRSLPWRDVGPVVQGGRIIDIEVVPDKPYSFYIAYASGGLWRTDNNGITFEPLLDHEASMIIGDIAVDPSNPETIWVGTGENNSSRSSYGGIGMLRSADGGKTWTQKGLPDSDRIGRILIDPRDSDRVLVAVLGKLYTPGGQRGIYRTNDGGSTWHQVQAGTEVTGFVDMVMDPSNPDILYAASWERFRRPWEFQEGGEGSGVWKSTDAGESWQRLEGVFPPGEHVGRIGLALSPSQPSIVYALLDNQEILPEDLWDLGDGAITPKRLRSMDKEQFLAQDPEEIEDFLRRYDLEPSLDAKSLLAKMKEDEITVEDLMNALEDANAQLFETDVRGAEVWRSDDAGSTWARTHEGPLREVAHTYGYYFGQIRVAPDNPDRIYILGVPLVTSGDGGKTFEPVEQRNVHGDHQALWIDPEFPGRLISGNDGGLNMSFDGGKSWLKLNAIPVGQFYAITVDNAEPYNIYGGLQDNGVLRGSSKSRPNIPPLWQYVGGGDGMYVQVDPRDNKTLYRGSQFGNYARVSPGQRPQRTVPRPKIKEPALRYNWCTPIQLSSHNPDILYFGANRLYRSMDQGTNWTAISPDLTVSENRGNVPFATISTLSESPKSFGLIWVGTDDGQIHLTRDGGVQWENVSGSLPSDRWVTRVEASPHNEKVAYVSLSGYRDDDITPYLYRTDDLGRSWTDISGGLPDEAVNVIREDPVAENVLYVGTDRGVYVSLNAGTSWHALSGGLPNVPVHDLVVHKRERELIAGTHGRSIWVLDVLPIQEMSPEVRASAAYMFPLGDLKYERGWKRRQSMWFHRPEDDPYLQIPFWLSSGGPARISVLDKDGRPLRTDTTDAIAGINSYRWDLLLGPDLAVAAETERLETGENEEAEEEASEQTEEDAEEAKLPRTPWADTVELERPLYVTPGTYKIQVEAGGSTSETELEVKAPDPRQPRVKPKPKIRGQKD